MTSNVSVRRMTSRADREAFVRFPWTVYKDDPNWVPPLLSMRRDKFDTENNPMLAHLTVEYFVAWRGAEPVGTIAAFVNHHHNEYHHENIGWFGMFDVLDDEEAALALLNTAEEWVRGQGKDALRGPASYGDMDEFGLQVDYFHEPHVLLMPYNPPYYQGFIEAAGFEGIMDLLSYRIPREALMGDNIPDKIKRLLPKLKERRKIELRGPDMKHLDQEVVLLREMYTAAWQDNWGFVPPTQAEMEYVVKQLRPFFDPELALIAEVEGKPIGFILLFPDLNQAFKYARPHPNKPEIFTLLQFLWHWKIRPKVNILRVPFLGVIEEYRGLGVDAMLYMAIAEAAIRKGYWGADFGWILDNNLAMKQVSDLIHGEVYKRYRMYHKPITSGE
ncbi:MAG: hypothetical protein JW910_11860 [Anaerolineae bacterium]|nr:hypothetical protein [Anaerolineae bacterium]